MVANVFHKNGLSICGAILACLILAGCGSSGFEPGTAVLESHPVKLDGEQVIIDQDKLDCGAREDLWNIAPLGIGRAVGRLTKKGRDLQFSDDVQIGDPAIGVPYAQIHGSFSVRVLQMGTVRDQDDYTKTADAKVGVVIDQSCFLNNPAILLGIRHGQFDQTTNPVFRFKMDPEWMVDQVIH